MRSRSAANRPAKGERPLTWPGQQTSSNGTQYEYQRIRNPHVAGEREKMLAKRDALTLKAFQIAFENHRQRKSS